MAVKDKKKNKSAPKSEFAKKLAAAQKHWDDAKEEAKSGGTFFDLEPGNYICRLTGANLKEVGDDDTLKLVLNFTAVSGESKGGSIGIWYNIENGESYVWLARDLQKLGIDVDEIDLTELESICEQLTEAKPGARVSVKQSGEYVNGRIQKGIEEDSMPEEDDEDDETEKGDEDDDAEIEEGDTVMWKDDEKKKHTGKVTKLGKSKSLVEDEDENEFKIPNDELTKVESEDDDDDEKEDDDEEFKPKKGMTVNFKVGKKKHEGKITSCPPNAKSVIIETDDEEFKVKVGDIIGEVKGDDDDDEEGGSEDVSEVEKGSKVSFEHEGKSLVGKVTKVKKDGSVEVVCKGIDYGLDEGEYEVLAEED